MCRLINLCSPSLREGSGLELRAERLWAGPGGRCGGVQGEARATKSHRRRFASARCLRQRGFAPSLQPLSRSGRGTKPCAKPSASVKARKWHTAQYQASRFSQSPIEAHTPFTIFKFSQGSAEVHNPFFQPPCFRKALAEALHPLLQSRQIIFRRLNLSL